ncbi:hypothetical protein PAESOLCIP111_01999 [Paenibacillus solanacearum]|uniref:SMP-30/Gluconolactonase/LRE-like region domain-containing protein n=1 Tax=Paenibacillus solanacearum TaxID=2048548 RepID=A0A916JZ46_9BACL|nr:hypothetical protein [Paenibacillus solanacearum]CAG7617241.1 hypothetical protein PAESOLCIP111_01999 [Paenibacillus solanacearum]
MSVRTLGIPMRMVNTPDASFGKGPAGEDWMYVVCTGQPAILSIIDVRTGSRVQSFELEGAEASWGSVVDPFGHLYIGTTGRGLLYRYVPGGDKPEKLGSPPGETHHWRIASDERGNIYSGTYPNGKVYRYDPQQRTFTDYGTMAAGEQYVRSVACGHGKVYAGTGSAQAQLFEIDPVSGEKRAIPLPERFREHKEIYDLSVAGGLLFARLTYPVASSPLHNVTLVYDVQAQRWIDEWTSTPGWDVSPPDAEGHVYFKQGSALMAYHLTDRRLTDTGLDISRVEATRGFGWIELPDKDFPGPSLVSSNMRCRASCIWERTRMPAFTRTILRCRGPMEPIRGSFRLRRANMSRTAHSRSSLRAHGLPWERCRRLGAWAAPYACTIRKPPRPRCTAASFPGRASSPWLTGTASFTAARRYGAATGLRRQRMKQSCLYGISARAAAYGKAHRWRGRRPYRRSALTRRACCGG